MNGIDLDGVEPWHFTSRVEDGLPGAGEARGFERHHSNGDVRLVTNALIHGGPPTVVLELRARRLHIAVADPGTGPVEALPVSASRGGGRGMFLVNAPADRWGVKTPSVGGKTAWCHLVVARA
ncbi:hypothetical protein GCM10010495_36250 [Kitasatospora herbaricolor]|uniref:ATP-binding protein n=1 Tax=Kitasatospora herbaricolor TaxID=68217 RepID=UPI001748CD2F|nr:ATP-binding protein [Kitasatospora herbaricolor]MDQ0310165.1 hypothetical protein [Kitasatospora herbaricolor]GGV18171.1 hypothetical protein GCM10010495_36250 [Kitasatospora herbaricolor]